MGQTLSDFYDQFSITPKPKVYGSAIEIVNEYLNKDVCTIVSEYMKTIKIRNIFDNKNDFKLPSGVNFNEETNFLTNTIPGRSFLTEYSNSKGDYAIHNITSEGFHQTDNYYKFELCSLMDKKLNKQIKNISLIEWKLDEHHIIKKVDSDTAHMDIVNTLLVEVELLDVNNFQFPFDIATLIDEIFVVYGAIGETITSAQLDLFFNLYDKEIYINNDNSKITFELPFSMLLPHNFFLVPPIKCHIYIRFKIPIKTVYMYINAKSFYGDTHKKYLSFATTGIDYITLGNYTSEFLKLPIDLHDVELNHGNIEKFTIKNYGAIACVYIYLNNDDKRIQENTIASLKVNLEIRTENGYIEFTYLDLDISKIAHYFWNGYYVIPFYNSPILNTDYYKTKPIIVGLMNKIYYDNRIICEMKYINSNCKYNLNVNVIGVMNTHIQTNGCYNKSAIF